ncbi:glucose 1-dehydrogenase [Rathayibacter agropyri]|uniref:glucose 1-dehydrogenase n=1 Tax=Rathayibacter agropyri TaxID=1634927 RepID=UPI0024836702|nr:glucose 1-dehydrogenase [Rathayibacter agropyri]
MTSQNDQAFQKDQTSQKDQYTFQDPAAMFADIDTEAQYQEGSGLDSKMDDPADRGESTYRGSGRLSGRKALVTGGDSGIGAAVAIAYAREGADVAIVYLPEEESDAKKVVAVIEEAGRIAVAIPGDLTDHDFAVGAVAKAVEGLGGLDILVNNAGKQQHVEDFLELSDEQFDETFKTNVYAMFWMTKAAVPHLAPGSAIISTSSIQAYQPSPMLVDYASTKATINTFSKALAQQLAPKGIRVNVVAPGPIWTPLQTAGGQPSDKLPEVGSQTPLGRWGQPAELAPAYVFLASPESSYVVGETLHVNGGMPTP